MIGFERNRSVFDVMSNTVSGISGELDTLQQDRLDKILNCWDFYEGYHWQRIPGNDSAEVTVNYCRPFVDKFVSFELGKGFSFITNQEFSDLVVTPDGRTLFQYLEDVWEDNGQYALCTELGQMKSITGEAWIQVRYIPPDELDDPFGEYPEGRLRLMLMPTSAIFPEYDPHDRSNLIKLTVLYQYQETQTNIFGKSKLIKKIYKQIWTKDICVVQDGNDIQEFPNRYGVIPFVLIKNMTMAGRTDCRGDLDDIIPLNTEYNLKKSNFSEILDYHAAPITIVYGAKVGNLEKGANKIWGGLSKDARVENLELKGDLGSSSNYMADLKLSMCEVGGIPETVLGGSQAISNTSGVALQYMNLPLIEKTRVKRANTETGLETLNKVIILVSIFEGLVFKPDDIPLREFLHTEVNIPDTLPKDALLELQQIETELKLRLETRENAMRRLGREDIPNLIKKIDEDESYYEKLFGGDESMDSNINSGFMNGQTPVEQVRTEITGRNGGEG